MYKALPVLKLTNVPSNHFKSFPLFLAAIAMWQPTIFVALLASSASCYFYLNRTETGINPPIANISVDFTHDATGQCIVNATFVTFVTFTKFLIYFKISLPENNFDRDFKRVLVSSVVEVEKVLKGMQSNLIISAIFFALRSSADFEFEMPLPPVNYLLTHAKHFTKAISNHRVLTGSSIPPSIQHCFNPLSQTSLLRSTFGSSER